MATSLDEDSDSSLEVGRIKNSVLEAVREAIRDGVTTPEQIEKVYGERYRKVMHGSRRVMNEINLWLERVPPSQRHLFEVCLQVEILPVLSGVALAIVHHAMDTLIEAEA
jgi:hypothetical protein